MGSRFRIPTTARAGPDPRKEPETPSISPHVCGRDPKTGAVTCPPCHPRTSRKPGLVSQHSATYKFVASVLWPWADLQPQRRAIASI